MNSDLLPTISDIISIVWLIISHGGWVVFIIVGLYFAYDRYQDEIVGQYKARTDWTMLEMKPPRENATSFYSMEQVLIQLHTLFDNFNFQERLIEGRAVFYVSLELVSLGGKVSYLIRVPTKHRQLVEASFYASYPDMEFTEVDDYLENYEYTHEDNVALFGADLTLIKDQVYPIRTYREFEGLSGPEVSQLVVDPIAPMLETLTKVNANEFLGYQFLIQPVLPGSWQEAAEKEIEELSGEKDYMQLDEVTKDQVSSLKRKLSRPGFNTKIRVLHLGPKESFNKDFKKLVLAPFTIFSSAVYNSFKPKFATKKDWMISPGLEKAYIELWVKMRKDKIFRGYKDRSTWIGEPQYILSSEEIATLYHFPITSAVAQTPSATIDMKKIQPPPDLPISNN